MRVVFAMRVVCVCARRLYVVSLCVGMRALCVVRVVYYVLRVLCVLYALCVRCVGCLTTFRRNRPRLLMIAVFTMRCVEPSRQFA